MTTSTWVAVANLLDAIRGELQDRGGDEVQVFEQGGHGLSVRVNGKPARVWCEQHPHYGNDWTVVVRIDQSDPVPILPVADATRAVNAVCTYLGVPPTNTPQLRLVDDSAKDEGEPARPHETRSVSLASRRTQQRNRAPTREATAMLTPASTPTQHKVRNLVMDVVAHNGAAAVRELDSSTGDTWLHVIGASPHERMADVDELARKLDLPEPAVISGKYSTTRNGVTVWTQLHP